MASLARDNMYRSCPEPCGAALSLREQFPADPHSPCFGRDKQILQFGLRSARVGKNGYEADDLPVELRDDGMWYVLGPNFLRFRKRLQLFNMISPGQRRPQLKCSEGIPVLVMRRSNENCHCTPYAQSSHYIKVRPPR